MGAPQPRFPLCSSIWCLESCVFSQSKNLENRVALPPISKCFSLNLTHPHLSHQELASASCFKNFVATLPCAWSTLILAARCVSSQRPEASGSKLISHTSYDSQWWGFKASSDLSHLESCSPSSSCTHPPPSGILPVPTIRALSGGDCLMNPASWITPSSELSEPFLHYSLSTAAWHFIGQLVMSPC